MELIASFVNGLRHRCPDAPPFVAQKGQQADGGTAELRWNTQECRHIQRRKNRGKTDNENRAGPDNVPGTDLQVQLRHPITSKSHHEQARRHEITPIDAAPQQPTDNRECENGTNTRRGQNQSGSGRIVSEK